VQEEQCELVGDEVNHQKAVREPSGCARDRLSPAAATATLALGDLQNLHFAKTGVLSLPSGGTGGEPDNEHEAAIGSFLKAHGYEVVPQGGRQRLFLPRSRVG
jgi:hypothetical protein